MNGELQKILGDPKRLDHNLKDLIESKKSFAIPIHPPLVSLWGTAYLCHRMYIQRRGTKVQLGKIEDNFIEIVDEASFTIEIYDQAGHFSQLAAANRQVEYEFMYQNFVYTGFCRPLMMDASQTVHGDILLSIDAALTSINDPIHHSDYKSAPSKPEKISIDFNKGVNIE